MTAHHRELLRPEDATSLEEFQARRIVEQAQIRGMNSSWKRIGTILLSSLVCVAAIIGWGSMAFSHGFGRWFWLTVAIGFTYWFVRMFGRIELQGARGTKRYLQLDRMSRQWQAQAEHGEIPWASPGGPRVWRDEPEGARIA